MKNKQEKERIIYNNNLEFYKILKQLIKCKLTTGQYINLQEILFSSRLNDISSNNLKELILNNDKICKNNTKKYEDFLNLVNIMDSISIKKWIEFVDLSIDLIEIKDLILTETKIYTKFEYQNKIFNIKDKLSLEYDMLGLDIPYGQRVISALLVYFITDINSNEEKYFLTKTINDVIEKIQNKVKILIKNYEININNIFSLIVNESINQSIISDAGVSYEDRISQVLANISDSYNGQSHDKNLNAVEYDFTFIIDNKLIGVSAKRTLRERYKQNWEEVEKLEVDYMCLITLGTDLNENKLNTILSKKGIFIVISNEIYEINKFMKNNNRIISSKDFNRENIKRLINSI